MGAGLNHDQRVLVSLSMWMADRVARTVARHSKRLSEQDLIQTARTALAESARLYDKEKDSSFEKYAWKRVVGSMLRELKREYRHHPRVIGRVLEALDLAATSLDEYLESDEDVSTQIDDKCSDFAATLFLGLAVEAWRAEGEDGAIRREAYVRALRVLREGLASLDESAARILRRRWLDSDEPGWPEIAQELGVSRSAAQRTEGEARERLKRWLLSRGLREMPLVAR